MAYRTVLLKKLASVLRDGSLVKVHETPEVDVGRLIHDMVGRPLEQIYPKTRSAQEGETLLEVNRLTRAGMFQDISFHVRAGEIVGLAGLVGAGRSELARAVFGLYGVSSGDVPLCGRQGLPRSAHDALHAGLVYVPEERKRQGLVLDHSLFGSDAMLFPEGAGAGLRYAAGDRTIHLTWENLPNLALWSKPGAGFVCLEPWHGTAAEVGGSDDLMDRPYVEELGPGATGRYSFKAEFAG